ncbi:MAG TPA: DotU family type IV/VI secretion system protein [Bryobacteraceae bacterium]|nr:DotU family type IV/VI secretion system protein [Bryobacteraceae bacterium]
MPTDLRDLSFISEFQDFYSEVIRLRRFAESGASPETTPSDPPSAEIVPASSPAQFISARLSELMDRQALFAGRSVGEIGYRLYREVQYVMAALADETFLRLDWPGRDYWARHLLETQLFDSHNAGEEIFARMDRLLDQPERSYTDIYAVYLMALSLGFRGKYWGADDGGCLERYRARLFARVYRRQPELFSGQSRLFPESYRHTLSEGAARRLPAPSRWFAALALAVLLWFGITWLLWDNLTGDLEASVHKILPRRAK